MKKIFFDTGILSKIAWSSEDSSIVCERWNYFLDQMEEIYPGFSSELFECIFSSALFLEVIGFGSIRENNKIKHSVFKGRKIEPLKSLVSKNEWKKYISNSELFVECVVGRINNFIRNKLSPRILYRQTMLFDRSYKTHPPNSTMKCIG